MSEYKNVEKPFLEQLSNLGWTIIDQGPAFVISAMEYLHDTIGIINFWGNIPEVSKLKGALSDLMLLSGIHPIEDAAEKLVTEITSLAKARHQEIMA